MTPLFYLQPALTLSPSSKAIATLLNNQVCVVEFHLLDSGKFHAMTIIDLSTSEITGYGDTRHIDGLESRFNEHHLTTEQGLSVGIHQRIWTTLEEWWKSNGGDTHS